MIISMNLSMVSQHESEGKQCAGENFQANTAYIT